MRWPGTKVACVRASAAASRQLQFAPAEVIVSRGNCRRWRVRAPRRVSGSSLGGRMDVIAFIAAVLELLGDLPSGGRVTVKDRYEMKKRLRELKKGERKS